MSVTRKLAVSAATLAFSLLLSIGVASSASAMDYTLPYGGSDCGTLSGPVLPTETTMYVLFYRVNGGAWVNSNWMATHRTSNWEFVGGGWQARSTNALFTPDLHPGSTVDRWAFVYRASTGGTWVNLGPCSQGGIVITYGR